MALMLHNSPMGSQGTAKQLLWISANSRSPLSALCIRRPAPAL